MMVKIEKKIKETKKLPMIKTRNITEYFKLKLAGYNVKLIKK